MKPIEWRVWAGEVERGRGGVEVKEGGGYVGNPFGGLEERSGFADVRVSHFCCFVCRRRVGVRRVDIREGGGEGIVE